ncbi:MAG: helix-hairpin-helix domain-containing protein [Candidatus Sabulitectum sp.]|nr:helix-hairpin-helix domain-containing protein [Candidatus Sabulitectum sp.]
MLLLLVIAISTLLDPVPLDMNSASEEELCRLCGIGRSTASAIVEYRETISPFASVDELIYVSGIGPATLENLLPYIEVTNSDVTLETSHFLQEASLTDTLLTVIFLDIGNGDAITLQAGESTWLIDGGPPGEGAMRAPVVQRLRECGIDSLSVVAFTHPHADHIGGCRDALELFHCDVLIDPGIDYPSPVYEGLLQYAFDSGCGYSVLSGEDRWDLTDQVSLEVVWLERGAGSPNEASAVYLVTCGKFTLLLTGDIENETIMRMTPFQTPVTVMKVPHHGSRSSFFPPWFRKALPQFAVFCCGRNNPFGHPHRDVLEGWESTGAVILRTDRQGNIFLYTDGESINFSSSLLF